MEIKVVTQNGSIGQTTARRSRSVVCPQGYSKLSNGVCRLSGVDPAKNNDICKAGANGSNPIHSALGIKLQQENDYSASFPDRLRFSRYYSSANSVELEGLGAQWRHNYARKIVFVESVLSTASVVRDNGDRYYFNLGADGKFIGDADINGILTRITDSNGQVTGWQYTQENVTEHYDAAGKLLSVKYPDGVEEALSYSTSATAVAIAPSPNLLIRVQSNFGRSLDFTYDIRGRITKMVDPAGNPYLYAYNSANNLISVTYPDETPALTTDNPNKIYIYGELANTANVSQPNALTGIIDENNQRFATWFYSASGKAISSEHAGGVEKTSLIYNADGTTSITDPLNSTRKYRFQTVLGVQKSAGVDQPGGAGCAASASNLSYDANGNLASRTDFNGNLSCYAYDLSRNLESVRVEGLPAGSTCPADLAVYTPSGSQRKVATQWHASYRLPSQIDQANQRSTFGYDANGNLLSKTLTDTASQQSRTWAYTYNALGQVLTADGPRTDVNDLTSYTYYADTTANHHPGDLHTVSNALGHTTTFTDYDANGRLLRLVDPNGLVVSFAYDPRGRLTRKTVDGHATTYDYDNVGNLIKVTRPSGVFYRFSYDAAHRLTDITDALGGNIHYTLDNMGNRIREDIKDAEGHVVKTHSRVYDALNRLAQDIGAYNQTTQYQYDPNGNLTQITDPNGHSTQQQYDSLNRLIRGTDALNGQTDYDYDALDRLVQVTDANNHGTVYSYNGLGDLTQLDSPNTGISQYSYDNAGNLAQKIAAGGVTATYQYDALNRLLGIDYPGTEADISYGYDWLVGNKGRLTSSRRGNAAPLYFYYDKRGNVVNTTATALAHPWYDTSIDRINYLYNADDQVTKVQFNWYRQHRYHYDQTGQVDRISVHDWDDGDFSRRGYDVTRILADNIVRQPFGPVTGLTYGNGLTLNRNYDQDYRLAGQSVGNQLNLAYAYDV
ncbi:DUF6531 domain-containing protein, partial [Methylomonas sp. SURF-2]